MTRKRPPEAAIQEYLEQQNRPYSAVDVFSNLHKEFGKTLVVKVLETLAADGHIVEKTYGKQKVYAPRQEKYGDVNEAELKSHDAQIVELKSQLAALQQHQKKQEEEIAQMNSQLTTEEAEARCTELEHENESLSTRITALTGSGATLVTREQRERVAGQRDARVKMWRKRKRLTMDVVDCILEGYPKSKRELMEETGVETDEDAGVAVPM